MNYNKANIGYITDANSLTVGLDVFVEIFDSLTLSSELSTCRCLNGSRDAKSTNSGPSAQPP